MRRKEKKKGILFDFTLNSQSQNYKKCMKHSAKN